MLLGAGCALVVSVDVIRRPRHMAVMNVVRPMTALFGPLAVLRATVRHGRLATMEEHHRTGSHPS